MSSFRLSSKSASDTVPPPHMVITKLLRTLVIALHHSFLVAPLWALACLYLLSWRASLLIGHWPLAERDDPNFIARGDGLMDLFYWGVRPGLIWSLLAIVLVPLLSFVLRRQYPRWWLITSFILFVFTWLGLFLDPGARINWFMD